MTRLVRWQLLIFTVVTVVGISVMALSFLRIPDKLGIGRYQVTVELEDTGGLYASSNVTYRGATIGRVTAVDVTRTGARATLDLDADVKVPNDSRADVHSRSAIGEQYLDLVPPNLTGPYLRDGDVIAQEQTSIPQDVGPLIESVNKTLQDIPRDQLGSLLDASYDAFSGADPAMRTLLDSVHGLAKDAEGNLVSITTLIKDMEPLLNSQAVTSDAIRTWAAKLKTLSAQASRTDGRIRTILKQGTPAMGQVNALFQQMQPTLPILLANLVSLGKVGVTYNPSLEQILVVLPQGVAALATIAVPNMDGTDRGFLSFNTSTLNSSPPCTTGFLPASERRDGSAVDSPPRTDQDLYCAVPQNSQTAVRGARNLPCMDTPGKRAPTVAMCKSDQEYRPLGNNPWIGNPTPTTDNPQLDAEITPSSSTSGPKVSVAPYDPGTGTVRTRDGTTFTQTDLRAGITGKDATWQTMLTPAA